MKFYIFLALIFSLEYGKAQVFSFESQENEKTINHRILIDDHYLIETQFSVNPSEFILTRGGFYSQTGTSYEVVLEFNSNHKEDSLTQFKINSSPLSLEAWKIISKEPLDLNGKWLMAGRVRDNKEQRRDTTRSRKTMKFLKDGFFQWIAFNTETFQFFGSGGGYYTTVQGKYFEHIEYFSRNNKSVGRILSFSYSISGDDWHHEGFSSKGAPIHEIWSFRKQKKNE